MYQAKSTLHKASTRKVCQWVRTSIDMLDLFRKFDEKDSHEIVSLLNAAVCSFSDIHNEKP